MATTRRRTQGHRKRWTEKEARRFLAGWQRSGEILPTYRRAQGVEYERVRRWRKELEGRPRTPAMELREVELARSVPPASGAEIEIELRTGHILRLRGGDEIGPLVSLVRALESA